MIEIARTPELCAEVSAGAVDALGVDGAVLFADVMLLVEAMGVELELTAEGPVIAHPIRSLADVARLRAVDVASGPRFRARGDPPDAGRTWATAPASSGSAVRRSRWPHT